MTQSPERAALSIPEAAHYTGLSRSSLYRMMQAGALASLKIGARRLIRREALDALLTDASERGAV